MPRHIDRVPRRKCRSKRAIWNFVHSLTPLSRRPPLHKCRLTQIIFEAEHRKFGRPIRPSLGYRPKPTSL